MLYFAYGSNMSIRRLQSRDINPVKVNVARLYGHTLKFHKPSKDGSGKCDVFKTDDEKELFEKAFVKFLQQWQKETEAKWWIDNRKITVRDISKKIAKISESIKMAS